MFRKVYKSSAFVDNQLTTDSMAQHKNKQEVRLQELILSAKRRNIHVRTEKLLREAGYRAKSGSCRVKGQDVILIDRDARISDQIEFLATELAEREEQSDITPPVPSEN
jgi:arginine deiminase